MTRSRLRNKYLKHETEENRVLYTQQRNKCFSFEKNRSKSLWKFR